MKWIILILFIFICIKFWEQIHEKIRIVFFGIIGSTDNKTFKSLFSLFKLAIYLTVFIFIINIFFNDFNKMGEWGDFFGGVLNPLLTFLTFMGLLITIVLQQTELKEAKMEYKGQKEALENQEFDNKFFQMLNLFNTIKKDLSHIDKQNTMQGHKLFLNLKEILLKNLNRNNQAIISNINIITQLSHIKPNSF